MSDFIETETLEKCINYLQSFEQDAGKSESGTYIAMCRQGLQGMLDNIEKYSGGIQAATYIRDCFMANLRDLAHIAELDGSYHNAGRVGSLNDLCFAMVEEIAVLVRERYLREGCKGLSPNEKSLMDYFEGSGMWFMGDSTMVSDYYYVKLPVAVLDGMLHKLESSTESVQADESTGRFKESQSKPERKHSSV